MRWVRWLLVLLGLLAVGGYFFTGGLLWWLLLVALLCFSLAINLWLFPAWLRSQARRWIPWWPRRPKLPPVEKETLTSRLPGKESVAQVRESLEQIQAEVNTAIDAAVAQVTNPAEPVVAPDRPVYRCPHCGHRLPSTADRCPGCGREAVFQCPYCHHTVEPTWTVCPQCGAALPVGS